MWLEFGRVLFRCVEVPLFTLQPIVENAFRHGLEEKLGKGRLIVRLTQRNNYLILRVYNDGIGMTKKKLNELRQRCNSKEVRIDQGQHIGIENVVYRLGMVFQDNVDYQIYSSTHKGTMFMIRILQQSD